MPKAFAAIFCLMLLLLAACAAPPVPAPRPAPTPRTAVAAWREVEVVPSARGEHAWLAAPLQPMAQDAVDPQPWSYRVYLPKQDGEQGGAAGERPLILLNLLASIEWDADDAYLNDFREALRLASLYLWDITDGQMAIGQARIVDMGESWENADIRVLARNTEAPHASIGGIREQDNPAAYRVQVGPFWNSNPTTNPYGNWSASDGHRTLAHELGHYVLGLYDEYKLNGSDYTSCMVERPDETEHLASAMNWQYTASELSARGVDGLWHNENCTRTLQWTRTGQSAWEHVVARFNGSPNWQVFAPSEVANAGPASDDWPAALTGIPAITSTNTAAASGPLLSNLKLKVTGGPSNESVPVWLSRPGKCAVSLGEVVVDSTLQVLGAHPDDSLFVKYKLPKDSVTFWCGTETLSATDAMSVTIRLEQHDDNCPFRFTPSSEDTPVASPSDAQIWLVNLDPAFAAVDRATGRMQPGAAWILPEEFVGIVQVEQSLNPLEQNLKSPNLEQWAADAAAALAEQGNAAPLVTGVGLCLPNDGPCTLLPVGVAAYTGHQEKDGPAPLTFSSADGRLQVYCRGELRTSRLMILDSPPVTRSNGELRSASRVYTLAGGWSGSLQVQIQAECCVDANAENTPLLFRFAGGEWHELGRPPFSPQESYVLATIDEPGSYALFR